MNLAERLEYETAKKELHELFSNLTPLERLLLDAERMRVWLAMKQGKIVVGRVDIQEVAIAVIPDEKAGMVWLYNYPLFEKIIREKRAALNYYPT